jgi:hypothetical protein
MTLDVISSFKNLKIFKRQVYNPVQITVKTTLGISYLKVDKTHL